MTPHCTFFQMCKGEGTKLVLSPIFKRRVPMCVACAKLYEVKEPDPVVQRSRAQRAFADDL